jgi:hypothetical protein
MHHQRSPTRTGPAKVQHGSVGVGHTNRDRSRQGVARATRTCCDGGEAKQAPDRSISRLAGPSVRRRAAPWPRHNRTKSAPDRITWPRAEERLHRGSHVATLYSLKPMASGPPQAAGTQFRKDALAERHLARSSATSSIVGQLAAPPARLLTFMTMRSCWVQMLSRRSKLSSLRCLSTTPTI